MHCSISGRGVVADHYRCNVLTRLDVRGAPDLRSVLPRPVAGGADETIVATVRSILVDVRERGDDALRELTERFDGVRIDDVLVDPADCKAALDAIPSELRDALELAAANIRDFSREETSPEVDHERDGLRVRTLRRPVERAGCYVPGGRAVYPSTVLMTAVPAR